MSRAFCAMLALTSTQAFQVSRNGGNADWNPLDIFRSKNLYAYEVDKALKPWVHPEGNRTTPRMLVSSGCDAASGILKHAYNVLALHGIETPENKIRTLHDKADHLLDTEDKRILAGFNKTNETHDIACDETCRAMVQTHQYFADNNKSLIFKGVIGGDTTAMLSKSIFEIGTLVVQTSRRNRLDQVVCMIKDCYNGDEYGHPEQNGKTSDLCWNRRKSEPSDYKAYVDVATLTDTIKAIEGREEKTHKAMKKMGYAVDDTLVSEDLLDFEWNKEALGTALVAWSRLLKTWKVHPQEALVKGYLESKAGLWDAPKKQKDTISNHDEVTTWVEGHDRFKFMLRDA